jgi:tRNA(fMet)-specific endonuclease VapC
MTWLLDTNACIRYLNGRSPALRAKLDAVDSTQICVCSVVKAELYFGSSQSNDAVKARASQDLFLGHFPSLAFDDRAAESYAAIRCDLNSRGLVIGPNDLLIAAICVANDVTLVTHNVAEFGRVPDLKVDDWEA